MPSSFFSASGKYPQNEKPLTEKEIKLLVSRIKIKSLQPEEESLVEQSLLARRGSDGKISLRQIHEVLTKLKNQNKISHYDREGLMEVFEEHLKNL